MDKDACIQQIGAVRNFNPCCNKQRNKYCHRSFATFPAVDRRRLGRFKFCWCFDWHRHKYRWCHQHLLITIRMTFPKTTKIKYVNLSISRYLKNYNFKSFSSYLLWIWKPFLSEDGILSWFDWLIGGVFEKLFQVFRTRSVFPQHRGTVFQKQFRVYVTRETPKTSVFLFLETVFVARLT